MALTATIYTFDIDLSDADRHVYESLSLRVARHPSESEEYLVARVFAYALEFADGIAFSTGGLSDPDAPAITVRDLTGALRSWIEVGAPEAAPRVAVYTHKDAGRLIANLAGERIHRAGALELYAIDRPLIAALTSRLDRRMAFALSVSGGDLYVSIGEDTITGPVVRHSIVG